jgi:hypothetical protein
MCGEVASNFGSLTGFRSDTGKAARQGLPPCAWASKYSLSNTLPDGAARWWNGCCF